MRSGAMSGVRVPRPHRRRTQRRRANASNHSLPELATAVVAIPLATDRERQRPGRAASTDTAHLGGMASRRRGELPAGASPGPAPGAIGSAATCRGLAEESRQQTCQNRTRSQPGSTVRLVRCKVLRRVPRSGGVGTAALHHRWSPSQTRFGMQEPRGRFRPAATIDGVRGIRGILRVNRLSFRYNRYI